MDDEHRIILNAKRMTSREQAHAYLARRLRLPEWYGKNLDALNDCLGEIGTPTCLLLLNAERMRGTQDGYAAKLLALLERNAEQNPNLRVVIREHWLR